MELEEIPVPGGYLVVVVRNQIMLGIDNQFGKYVRNLTEPWIPYVGRHPRRLRKTAWGQLREKANPGAPWIDTEYALVFRK